YGFDRHIDEGFRYPNLQPNLLLQLHLDGGATVGLDPIGFPAVPHDAGDGESPHLGAIQRLEHLVESIRPDDGDDEFHEILRRQRAAVCGVSAGAGALAAATSGMTRIEPSPLV